MYEIKYSRKLRLSEQAEDAPNLLQCPLRCVVERFERDAAAVVREPREFIAAAAVFVVIQLGSPVIAERHFCSLVLSTLVDMPDRQPRLLGVDPYTEADPVVACGVYTLQKPDSHREYVSG